MLNKKMIDLLNKQIELEAMASQVYLAMASWAEVEGLEGASQFFYEHSDEERMHMLKLFHYVNERGGHAIVPILKSVPTKYKNLEDACTHLLSHEVKVTESINNLIDHALSARDHTTHVFLQWYVQEQLEEERLARQILDKIKLIANDKAGLYLLDRELGQMLQTKAGGGKKGGNNE
jgi:ferritin